MKQIWEPMFGCHYGEDAILDWIHDTTSDFPLLYLDEINQANRQWL